MNNTEITAQSIADEIDEQVLQSILAQNAADEEGLKEIIENNNSEDIMAALKVALELLKKFDRLTQERIATLKAQQIVKQAETELNVNETVKPTLTPCVLSGKNVI